MESSQPPRPGVLLGVVTLRASGVRETEAQRDRSVLPLCACALWPSWGSPSQSHYLAPQHLGHPSPTAPRDRGAEVGALSLGFLDHWEQMRPVGGFCVHHSDCGDVSGVLPDTGAVLVTLLSLLEQSIQHPK